MKILLIEDDQLLGNGLSKGLKLHGHHVHWVRNGLKGEQVLQHHPFDVIVLDIVLPGINGFALLKKIRSDKNFTPVLILTAREFTQDRIKGLDLGADDYLTKPFDLDELCARLRAIERRSFGRATSQIIYQDLVLDPIAHNVTYKNKPVELSRREFDLLKTLLENEGRTLSREFLQQKVYDWESNVDSNALEVHIHNLRKKFGQQFIRTIRGVGYIVQKKVQ